MTRREYNLTNSSLTWFLYEKRIRCTPFRALPSAREAHLCWIERNRLNNKHTMGTVV